MAIDPEGGDPGDGRYVDLSGPSVSMPFVSSAGTGFPDGYRVPRLHIHRFLSPAHPPYGRHHVKWAIAYAWLRQYVTVCRAAAGRLEHEHLVVTPFAA
jgi:hypothetical protein